MKTISASRSLWFHCFKFHNCFKIWKLDLFGENELYDVKQIGFIMEKYTMEQKQQMKQLLIDRYNAYLKMMKKHSSFKVMTFEEWIKNEEDFSGYDLNIDNY